MFETDIPALGAAIASQNPKRLIEQVDVSGILREALPTGNIQALVSRITAAVREHGGRTHVAPAHHSLDLTQQHHEGLLLCTCQPGSPVGTGGYVEDPYYITGLFLVPLVGPCRTIFALQSEQAYTAVNLPMQQFGTPLQAQYALFQYALEVLRLFQWRDRTRRLDVRLVEIERGLAGDWAPAQHSELTATATRWRASGVLMGWPEDDCRDLTRLFAIQAGLLRAAWLINEMPFHVLLKLAAQLQSIRYPIGNTAS